MILKKNVFLILIRIRTNCTCCATWNQLFENPVPLSCNIAPRTISACLVVPAVVALALKMLFCEETQRLYIEYWYRYLQNSHKLPLSISLNSKRSSWISLAGIGHPPLLIKDSCINPNALHLSRTSKVDDQNPPIPSLCWAQDCEAPGWDLLGSRSNPSPQLLPTEKG